MNLSVNSPKTWKFLSRKAEITLDFTCKKSKTISKTEKNIIFGRRLNK